MLMLPASLTLRLMSAPYWVGGISRVSGTTAQPEAA